MKDFKLINLLKGFSSEEFKEFEKFIASPYFSRGRDLTPLFKAIKPFYPDFASDDFNLGNIFKKLFPGNKFGDPRSNGLMKTLISELFKMSKDFLIHSELKNDEKRKSYYLLNQLRKKKSYKQFDREYSNSLVETDNALHGSVMDFIDKYFLSSVSRDYFLDRDDFESSFECSLTTSEYSVVVALINSFKYEDEKNLAVGYNLQLRYNLMDNLLENLDSEKLLEKMKANNDRFYPYMTIFYMVYRMNKYKDRLDYYSQLKTLLQEHSNLFGQSENYVLWNIMLTYCNVNHLPMEELFQIFKYMLERNFYKKSEKEDFHIVLFRNIVIVTTYLEEYDWLENFIHKFSGELHTDHKEDMKNYSLSYIAFLKGEFGTALEQILKIRYELFLYKSDVKSLMLRIYYELGYYEQVYSTIDTTLHYVKSTKEISDQSKESIRNFTKYLKEVIKLKINDHTPAFKLEFLEMQIKEEKILGARDWLLKKVRELA